MSNGQKATGLDQIAAAAEHVQSGPTPFEMFQHLPAPVRPQKMKMGLMVEVQPNPNMEGPAKLIVITKLTGDGINFTCYEPDEWDAIVALVAEKMPEARSSLLTAKPGDLAGIPAALRPRT